MKRNIIIGIVITIIVILTIIFFTLANTTPTAKPVTDVTVSETIPTVSQIFTYPTITETGYGIVNGSVCYIDEYKNLRLSNGKSDQVIQKLTYETARILSNGSSCVIDIINGINFDSFLLTKDLTVKSFENMSTRPLINSNSYQICKDDNCYLFDSSGATIKNFSSDNAVSTPEADGSYFEVTGYNEEYVAGELSYVRNGKASSILDIDQHILSLHANNNVALLSTEDSQYSTSVLIDATTGRKYTLSDVDPSSVALAQDGFIYASKSGDIAETNQVNSIYLLSANGERRPILASDESNALLSFNINNLIYNESSGIIYWQDSSRVFSLPAGM